jgi:hypothetical protein
MLLTAEELIAPGGPSAPVWVFLTTIMSLVVVNVFQLIGARVAAKEAAKKATETAQVVTQVQESADRAASNTQNVANGFAGNIDRKLDVIYTAVQDIEGRFAEHLSWHLNQEKEHHHARPEQPQQRPRQGTGGR